MSLDKVTVLNYNENYVFAPADGTGKTYAFTPSIDGVPSQATMTFVEAEYINGQSDAFRTGMLFFKHKNPEEIYKALNIDNYKDILSNQDIENIFLHPTIEGLQRILDVREHSTFDRIRAVFVSLKNSNNVDLSNRVIKLIEQRTEEMRKNKYQTDIILQPRDASNNNVIESESVIALREQNDSMRKQLKEMKEMMAQFMSAQNKTEEKIDVDEGDKNEPESEKKKSDRPPKSKE